MAKKGVKLGMASAVAVGAGAAMMAKKVKKSSADDKNRVVEKKANGKTTVDPEYRNTERGKYEKNSKGIYYSNGNYEAFARPEKPQGVDEKNAYIVGS